MPSAKNGVLGRPTTDRVDFLFNGLRRLVNALHSASRETQRSGGVTAAQLFVLSQVQRSPHTSINALAEMTLTHQSTVSVVVRRLARRKLVRKRRAADDARRVELTITPAGRQVLERAPEAFQIRLRQVLAELDCADQDALAATLARLLAGLGAADAPAGMFFESIESPS